MTHQDETLQTRQRTVTGRVSARKRYSAHTIIVVETSRGRMELYATRGGVEGVVIEGETWSFELDGQGRVASGQVL